MSNWIHKACKFVSLFTDLKQSVSVEGVHKLPSGGRRWISSRSTLPNLIKYEFPAKYELVQLRSKQTVAFDISACYFDLKHFSYHIRGLSEKYTFFLREPGGFQ